MGTPEKVQNMHPKTKKLMTTATNEHDLTHTQIRLVAPDEVYLQGRGWGRRGSGTPGRGITTLRATFGPRGRYKEQGGGTGSPKMENMTRSQSRNVVSTWHQHKDLFTGANKVRTALGHEKKKIPREQDIYHSRSGEASTQLEIKTTEKSSTKLSNSLSIAEIHTSRNAESSTRPARHLKSALLMRTIQKNMYTEREGRAKNRVTKAERAKWKQIANYNITYQKKLIQLKRRGCFRGGRNEGRSADKPG